MAQQGSFIDRHLEQIARIASTHWSPKSCEVQFELGNQILLYNYRKHTVSVIRWKICGLCACATLKTFQTNNTWWEQLHTSNFHYFSDPRNFFTSLATSSRLACGLMSNAAKVTALALQLDQCAQRTSHGLKSSNIKPVKFFFPRRLRTHARKGQTFNTFQHNLAFQVQCCIRETPFHVEEIMK